MAPQTIVTRFLEALNKEDFQTAATFLAQNMRFDGVLGQRDSAQAYIADMEKMKFKYNILKTFEHENDVCILYYINMGKGAPVFTCGWYQVSDQRIKNIKVVFDPRPLFSEAKKQ